MPDDPLFPSRRVYHCNQRWEAARRGTATITAVKGPYNDGSYEYEVLTTEDFSRRPGPDNPETRRTWWSSLATIPAEEAVDA
jgi:hypothetical protein